MQFVIVYTPLCLMCWYKIFCGYLILRFFSKSQKFAKCITCTPQFRVERRNIGFEREERKRRKREEKEKKVTRAGIEPTYGGKSADRKAQIRKGVLSAHQTDLCFSICRFSQVVCYPPSATSRTISFSISNSWWWFACAQFFQCMFHHFVLIL